MNYNLYTDKIECIFNVGNSETSQEEVGKVTKTGIKMEQI